MGGVSGGFDVVLSDLARAAAAFRAESGTFEAIMPDACLAVPDGGSTAFDENLGVLTNWLRVLHHQIASVIGLHATKLQQAHDTYIRRRSASRTRSATTGQRHTTPSGSDASETPRTPGQSRRASCRTCTRRSAHHQATRTPG